MVGTVADMVGGGDGWYKRLCCKGGDSIGKLSKNGKITVRTKEHRRVTSPQTG